MIKWRRNTNISHILSLQKGFFTCVPDIFHFISQLENKPWFTRPLGAMFTSQLCWVALAKPFQLRSEWLCFHIFYLLVFSDQHSQNSSSPWPTKGNTTPCSPCDPLF